MEDLLIMKEQTGSVVVTLETACYLDKKKKKLQGAFYSFVHKGSLVEFRISWPDCILLATERIDEF